MPFGFPGYDAPISPLGFPGYDSTPRVGINSGETPGNARAPVDTRAPVASRFRKGNPWRWKRGQSGNRRGRPRKGNEVELWSELLDHSAQLHDLQRRLRLRRDSRFERFKVYHEDTGNAFQSALRAGYAPNTAKSKAYLLARRAREATGTG